MHDNMIVNMSSHTGKSMGIDMEIEHLIRLDKVCVVVKQHIILTMHSSISFSFMGSTQTGTVSGTFLQLVPSAPSSRSVVMQNSNHNTLGLHTHTQIPRVIFG